MRCDVMRERDEGVVRWGKGNEGDEREKEIDVREDTSYAAREETKIAREGVHV